MALTHAKPKDYLARFHPSHKNSNLGQNYRIYPIIIIVIIMFPAHTANWTRHPLHFNPLLTHPLQKRKISNPKSNNNLKKVAPMPTTPSLEGNAEYAAILDQGLMCNSLWETASG